MKSILFVSCFLIITSSCLSQTVTFKVAKYCDSAYIISLFKGTWEDTLHPGHIITFTDQRTHKWGYDFSEVGKKGIISTSKKEPYEGYWKVGWDDLPNSSKPDSTCTKIDIEFVDRVTYLKTVECTFLKNATYMQIIYEWRNYPYYQSWAFIFKKKQ